MRFTMWCSVGLLSAAAFMQGCFSTNLEANNKLVISFNDFAFKMYRHLSGEVSTKKLIFSPYSIAVALSMLYMGAKSGTGDEMEQVLGYKATGLKKDQVENEIFELIAAQNKNHNAVDLSIANSMWMKKGMTFLEQYKSVLQNKFHAMSEVVNFGDKGPVIAKINDWISQQTKGKITDMLKDLDSDTLLILVNAIYFKGMWKTEFKKKDTKEEIFNNLYSQTQTTKKVPMMRITETFKYKELKELEAELLEIPYKDEEHSMVIVMPKKNHGLQEIEKKISAKMVNEALDSAEKVNTFLQLPKFNLSSLVPLNAVLKSMGMKSAFDLGKADLSGIAGGKNLYVSDVLHQSVCEVNEEGTVAAAATVIGVSTKSAHQVPLEFIVDHPFLFLIRNSKTKLILFVGRVYEL